MKTKRKANHHQKQVPSSWAELFSLRQPIFEVLSKNRHIVDGVNYEFVKLAANFPRPSGKWDRASITVRLADGASLSDAIQEILALDEQDQLIALAKEVEHV